MEELSEEVSSAEAPAITYRRYLERGTLAYQRCAECSAAVFYPRVLCPVCGVALLFLSDSSLRAQFRVDAVA